jgi:hypothetical protein
MKRILEIKEPVRLDYRGCRAERQARLVDKPRTVVYIVTTSSLASPQVILGPRMTQLLVLQKFARP